MPGTSPKRVLFYVQHLLGVGHVRRASLISAAMAEAGMEVHVALGGAEVPDITFPDAEVHRLPEARAADASFSSIVDAVGSPITEQWRARRREIILNLFHSVAPDILLVEQFPFGRRQFRFELIPLLDAARRAGNSPRIACSVRDLLVKKNDPKRARETADVINQYFDQVFVHGDPSFLPLDVSFEETARIAGKLQYTGYVAPMVPAPNTLGAGEVIVAAGGGAVGRHLLKTAVAAKPMSSLNDRVWRILMGPNLDIETRAELESTTDANIVVESNRKDYPALLRNCALSISQAGYNTLMDIVMAQCPAIVVPFADGGETEQTVRAQLLADAQHVTLLPTAELSPHTLARLVDSAYSRIPPETPPFQVDGAAKTAEYITVL